MLTKIDIGFFTETVLPMCAGIFIIYLLSKLPRLHKKKNEVMKNNNLKNKLHD